MKTILFIFLVLVSVNIYAQVQSQEFDRFDFKKGFTLGGTFNATSIAYTASGESRRDPFDYYLTGGLNVGLFGYSVPFSFNYSNRKTNYTQPFNNFKFNPSYKWARAYFGTTSMSFSDYTLSGHLFSGVGVELTPGKWEIAAMYGKLQSAVEPSRDQPTQGEATYKRLGFGVKVGYNGDGWRSGANIFRAYDQQNSLSYIPPEAQLEALANTAVGLTFQKNIFKKISFDGQYSFSVMQKQAHAFWVDTTGSNPYKVTRKYYDAMNFGLGYQAQWYGIQVRYERVAPGYQSLGAYYFTQDMQNITLVPSLRLLQGKLNITSNFGIQTDNLDGAKTAKTKRFVGSGNISYVPNEAWNFTSSYSNFNTYTRHRLQNDPYFRDELDSLNFYQISQSLQVGVGHNFGPKTHKQSLMLSLSAQKSSEEQKANQQYSNASIFTGSLSYSLLIEAQKLTLSFANNATKSNAPSNNSLYIGPSANVAKSFFDNKFRASWGNSFSFNSNKSTVNTQSKSFSSRLAFDFSPASKKESTNNSTHKFGSQFVFLQNFAASNKGGFNELTATLNYTYSF